MMRTRISARRTLFFVAILVFALIALLPLRLAIDRMGFADHGLSARAATGSLWRGALQEARIGPVQLGDVSTRLAVLPLFLGRARLALAATEEGGLKGALSVTRSGFGFEDFSGRLGPGEIVTPLPLASVELDGVSAGFANGRCARAQGGVRATIGGPLAGLGLAADLAGTVRCAGDALLIPLAGRSGTERIDLRLFGDGRYQADLIVRAADPALAPALAAAGFRAGPQGQALRISGTF